MIQPVVDIDSLPKRLRKRRRDPIPNAFGAAGPVLAGASVWRKKENPKPGLGFALGDLGGWWGDRQELGHPTTLPVFRSGGFQKFPKIF
jgi:hypothetical protein